MLEKIYGILSGEEYLRAIENLNAIGKEFEKWELELASF